MKTSCPKLQAFARMVNDRHRYLEKKDAALVIASWTRMLLCMSLLRNMIVSQREAAAVLLQSKWRGHFHREGYKKMRKAASVLQRVAMAHAVSRRLLAYAELQRSIRREAAAVKLQSQWRCHSHLQRFHKVRVATLVIQRMATAHAARCRQIAQAELEQSIAQKDPERFEENVL